MKWMVTISNLNLNTIHFAHCVRLVAATRLIDDIRMYPMTLTAEEIAALAH